MPIINSFFSLLIDSLCLISKIDSVKESSELLGGQYILPITMCLLLLVNISINTDSVCFSIKISKSFCLSKLMPSHNSIAVPPPLLLFL